MFLYQTLDAIDGKQARRTGSSNALGELFDHGCDSLSNRNYHLIYIRPINILTAFYFQFNKRFINLSISYISVVLSTAGACAMSMGYIDSFLMMGYCYLALVLFYLSHWQTYVTGIYHWTILVRMLNLNLL